MAGPSPASVACFLLPLPFSYVLFLFASSFRFLLLFISFSFFFSFLFFISAFLFLSSAFFFLFLSFHSFCFFLFCFLLSFLPPFLFLLFLFPFVSFFLFLCLSRCFLFLLLPYFLSVFFLSFSSFRFCRILETASVSHRAGAGPGSCDAVALGFLVWVRWLCPAAGAGGEAGVAPDTGLTGTSGSVLNLPPRTMLQRATTTSPFLGDKTATGPRQGSPWSRGQSAQE